MEICEGVQALDVFDLVVAYVKPSQICEVVKAFDVADYVVVEV